MPTAAARLRSVVTAAIMTALVAAPSLAQSLTVRIQEMLSDPALSGTKTGVVLIDVQTGETLAAVNADEPFIPASNMKVLTSGCALAVLGPEFRFRTELIYDPSFRSADGRSGRVVLRGSGDPALADPELLKHMKMTVDDLLGAWAGALKKAGAAPPAELVIDDRVFDREFVHPTWPVQQLNRWYCAEVAGVNFHANVLSVFAEPTAEGQPPRITMQPAAPGLQIRNRARSVKSGNQTVWASRELSSNSITLHGDVRWSGEPVAVALTDNPSFLGSLLGQRMSAEGLAPGTVRLADPEESLEGGAVVHVIVTDLPTILSRCNMDSHNLYAEALLKRMGHHVTGAPGSWNNGSAVMRMVLTERLGPSAGQSITVADGSGMSRENRVSARMLGQWLVALASDRALGDPFFASLPEAGNEGTLQRRFRDKSLRYEVRAKSGYLTGVTALSGCVTDRNSGRRVVFSVITNDKPNRVRLSAVRDMEERVVVMAEEWLGRQTRGSTSRP